MWAVFNIGCIECGVSSNLVGVFDDKDRAQTIADTLDDKHSWREHGQNHYEVFEIGSPNEVAAEYLEYVGSTEPKDTDHG